MMSRDLDTLAADQVLVDIVGYVRNYRIARTESYRAARYCLIDSLGCAMEALNFPECTKLLGPVVPGAAFPGGARVPGTRFELDPVAAAFNIGTMIRWLDMNDTFSNFESGHPSDNLGAILATADYVSRKRVSEGKPPLLVREVLTALIKTYEIQVVLSLENSLSRLAFDYVTFAKVAAAPVATQMLGGGEKEMISALSNAWADGVSLRIYRQGKDTGSRKSWAGGDAASRAVQLGLMAMKGEMGYPRVLTAKTYGIYDTAFKGEPFKLSCEYGEYAVNDVLFKLFPAAMESQSAVECAFRLHPVVRDRIEDIEGITIRTHKKMLGVMDKRGPLTNPADRDHCAQYVVAVALLHGKLDASDFDDDFAADPRIDRLREKMTIVEEPRYTRERLDPQKRSNSNCIEVRFRDGSATPAIEVEYPIGHPRRRREAIPLLEGKFGLHLGRRFPKKRCDAILDLCMNQARLEATPVNELLDRFVI